MINDNESKAREPVRQALAADVERFLASGGKIQWCDSSWNVGSDADLKTIERRRFDLRIEQETFGKRDESRMVVRK